MSDTPKMLTALKNGLRRRCPQCGQGALLEGWMTVRDGCPTCGLVYERNAGDTWAFWIVGDRIPLAIAIVIVYFGFGPRSWVTGSAFLVAFALIMLATIPQRLGIVLALDYLTRRWWPDADNASRSFKAEQR